MTVAWLEHVDDISAADFAGFTSRGDLWAHLADCHDEATAKISPLSDSTLVNLHLTHHHREVSA